MVKLWGFLRSFPFLWGQFERETRETREVDGSFDLLDSMAARLIFLLHLHEIKLCQCHCYEILPKCFWLGQGIQFGHWADFGLVFFLDFLSILVIEQRGRLVIWPSKFYASEINISLPLTSNKALSIATVLKFSPQYFDLIGPSYPIRHCGHWADEDIY